jgi:hypothetical protein
MQDSNDQDKDQSKSQPENKPNNQLEEFIQREKAKIVGETAKAPWKELERFYAQGVLILVDNTLDLVEVGYTLSIDNADQIKQWMDDGLLKRNFDQQAIKWEKENAEVWTVVIRPWVLIQDA